jgi:hypothetical protein
MQFSFHDKQNRTCLDCNKNLVMRPGGAHDQDGLTDWPTDRPTDWLTVSFKVTQTDKDTRIPHDIITVAYPRLTKYDVLPTTELILDIHSSHLNPK